MAQKEQNQDLKRSVTEHESKMERVGKSHIIQKAQKEEREQWPESGAGSVDSQQVVTQERVSLADTVTEG